MNSPSIVVSPEIAFATYDLVGFGKIQVPDHPLRFGFQVDIIPSQMPPHVLFALVTRVRDREGRGQTHGFAVRLDLESGEIWDVLNDSGIVGWIDDPQNLDRYTDEEPMLLNWEIEHLGLALIPKLQVGEEQWLYPALSCRETIQMDTLAGTIGGPEVALRSFLHPAVWREHVG